MRDFIELPKHLIRKRIIFSGNTVALIVRGKTSERDSPDYLAQHADVVLPNGEIIGFYGKNAGRSGVGLGFNLKGVVYDTSPNGLMRTRPWYIDINLAEQKHIISTILILHITTEQAIKFTNYWGKLTKKPGEFDIVGDNCSTHAASGFQKAGLIKGEIPGLDTPDNLYRLLRHKYKASSQSISGYLGLELRKIKPPLIPRFNVIIDQVK